jgi:CheY-like chemotaxis protein
VRILLVEDNEVNRDMLERRLRFRGYEVDSAGDGESALTAVGAQPPDVVLMDMSLPKMDGWEATRRLKADPKTHGIPVIALTAHALREDEERAREAGCDGFHAKPVEMNTLLDLIQTLAARAGK